LVKSQKTRDNNSNFKDNLFRLSFKPICVFCFSHKTHTAD